MGDVKKGILSVLKMDRGNTSAILKMIGLDGGKGSGNFGHQGRPGKRGGSAKRGGGGGSAYEEKVKKIEEERKEFKKLSLSEKLNFGKSKGYIPMISSVQLIQEAEKKGMEYDKYIEYCVARGFTIDKFKPSYGSGKYVTPLKPVRKQEKYVEERADKIKKIQDDLGVDSNTATAMMNGLSRHFSIGTAIDPWIDRYIDADGRYEGTIYRWKGYLNGEKADEVVAGLVPGAKIGNKYGSNWSFSSDMYATREFGSYESPSFTTICYICDDNKTASPVQCYSGYNTSEAEVLPHSQTTWTIQSVEKTPKKNGGWQYTVHMTEDDWHDEKNIPVWSYDEYKKDWRSNFPTEVNDANNIFQDIKTNDGAKMNEFLESCPEGTTIISEAKSTMLKKVNGKWMGVGVDFDKIESFDDFSWEKYADKAKVVGSAAQFTAWEADSYIYDMKKPKPTFKQMDDKFNSLVHDGDENAITDFLKEAPAGTQFSTTSAVPGAMQTMIFTKKPDGSWSEENDAVFDVDPEDIWMYADDFGKLVKYPIAGDNVGGHEKDFKDAIQKISDELDPHELQKFCKEAPTGTAIKSIFHPYSENEMMFVKQDNGNWLDTNGVYKKELESDKIWTLISSKESGLVNYPDQPDMGLPKQTPQFYGEVEGKLFDLSNEQDYDGVAVYLENLPNGTQLYDEDNDYVWVKEEASPTYNHWVCHNGKNTMTNSSNLMSSAIVNKQSISVFKLPLKTPENKDTANKVFTDLICNKPENLGEFIGSVPDGTIITSLADGGGLFKKEDGEWKVIYGATHPKAFKHWEDKVQNTNGIEVMKNCGAGTFITKWGDEKLDEEGE